MTRDREPRNDPELQRSMHDLADAFELKAAPEQAVVAALEHRVNAGRRWRAVGAAALAVVVVAAAAVGIRALDQPQVGGPVATPELAGLFVTTEPNLDGRCHAIRLYDTTPADGRVALWTWTGTPDCSERTSNLFTGPGRADGVRLPSGAGIRIRATEDAPAALEGLELVLVADGDAGSSVQAYESVLAAADGSGGIRLAEVEELEVPYRPF